MEPAMDYTKCPACNASRRNKTDVISVFECRRCGAIYGTCYLGESYGPVKPFFATEDGPPERCRYFDFTTLGSAGVDRRHDGLIRRADWLCRSADYSGHIRTTKATVPKTAALCLLFFLLFDPIRSTPFFVFFGCHVQTEFRDVLAQHQSRHRADAFSDSLDEPGNLSGSIVIGYAAIRSYSAANFSRLRG
jgi:hypothetical protein